MVEPIRDKELINKAAEVLREDRSEQGERRYLLFLTGLFLGRRVCDMRKMRVGDVLGREKFVIIEQKTGKRIELFISKKLRKAYKERLAGRDPEEWLFPSPDPDKVTGKQNPISYRTLLRDMQEVKAIMKLPADYNIGTHSLRKTFGYHYYRETHDVATLMKLFNHSKEETTLIYIGIASDEIKAAFLKVDRMYDT